MRSALKLNAAQLEDTANSAEMLKERESLLASQAEALKRKKEALNQRLQEAVQCFGEDSTEAAKLRTQLNNVETQYQKVNAEIQDVNAQLKSQEEAAKAAESGAAKLTAEINKQESQLSSLKAEYVNAVLEFGETSDEAQQLASQINDLSSELSENKSKMEAAQNAAEQLGNKQEDTRNDFEKLADAIADQQKDLDKLKAEYANAVLKFGETSDEAQQLASQIDDLSADLKENKKSLSDAENAADELDNTLGDLDEAADEADDGFTTFKATMADLASNAIQEAISGIKEIAGEIINLGLETETAFAKLETIAGTENIDALTESVTQLSRETGVSSAELADVAYNAISAGASAEEACGMVEAATKLAAAGFTDSENALSVLSTAINSYGDAAGTAAEISDSLITVQNLGVTTIGDLSSSIGKAIATGSAYSVNLANLESAYISLTKAGISTEESTTYLNSMLNELGDTGSSVSSVIQEKTGKSFTELMKDGYSLSDVLAIVYDSVGNDSTALMNLWSSAEAGKASNAIVNQGLEEFNENLEAIANSTGTTESAYATMTDTVSHNIDLMKNNFQTLGLEVYNGLEEPLNNAVGFINTSVIPAAENIITWLGECGNAIEGLGDITSFFSSGFVDAIDGWKSHFSDAIKVFADNTIGMFGSKLQELSELFKDFGTVLQPIAEFLITRFANAFDNLLAIWNGAIIPAISFVIDAFAGLGSAILSHIAPAVQEIMGKFGELQQSISEIVQNYILPVIQSFIDMMQSLWEENQDKINLIGQAFQTGFEFIATIVSGFTEGFKNYILPLFEWLRQTVSDNMDNIKSFFQAGFDIIGEIAQLFISVFEGDWNNAWESIKNIISSAWQAVQAIFSTASGIITGILEELVNTIATALEPVWSAIVNVFEGIVKFLQSVWETIKNVVQIAIMFIAEVITAGFELITLPFRFIWENCKETVTEAWETIKTSVSVALEEIKETVSSIWNGIVAALSPILNEIQTVVSTAWNAIKAVVTTVINTIKTTISTVWNAISSTISSILNSIKNIFSTTWNGIKSVVSSVINSVKSLISSGLQGAFNTVSNILGNIKNKFSTIFESAKNIVSSGIEKIKSFFKFSWSLPKLKLPHFNITGEFSLNPPSVPKFGIEWYAKGAVFEAPTILQTLAGYKGVGEAGAEAVLPIDILRTYIREEMESFLNEFRASLTEIDYDKMASAMAKQNVVLKVKERELGRVIRGEFT